MMKKAVLQNCIALNILAASQGGTCAVICTEYCIFVPDESSNVTSLMTHRKCHISALNNPLPSLGETLGKWFDSGGSWLKSLLMMLLILLAILVTVCGTYKVRASCLSRYVSLAHTKIMMSK